MAQNKIEYKVVVVGGSAGSLDIILKIISNADATGSILYIIVIHRKNDTNSMLTGLFSSRTKLKVKEVEDKDYILPGHIYIAPPDYHLLLENQNTFSLDASEKIYFSRPSIDVTFESVAEIFGASVIGVLLSGANADGAHGLSTIHQAGGFTIVQDPESAEADYMPRQAIDKLKPDIIISADKIPDFLKKLISSSQIIK
ncbi:MAG TPA: chemotaxis protein CheB [Parafilimonas sp.]|nr:chemotaxis protein CheB [Parafilimonas sp.]